MQALLNALAYITDQINASMRFIASWAVDFSYKMVAWVFSLPGWIWKVVSFVGWAIATVAACTITALGYIGDALHTVVNKIAEVDTGGITTGTTPPVVANLNGFLDGLNTFLPIEFIVACLTVLMALRLVSITVRSIKAWLPKIAGFGIG